MISEIDKTFWNVKAAMKRMGDRQLNYFTDKWVKSEKKKKAFLVEYILSNASDNLLISFSPNWNYSSFSLNFDPSFFCFFGGWGVCYYFCCFRVVIFSCSWRSSHLVSRLLSGYLAIFRYSFEDSFELQMAARQIFVKTLSRL